MNTISNLTVNVDLNDEVLNTIEGLQSQVDILDAKISDLYMQQAQTIKTPVPNNLEMVNLTSRVDDISNKCSKMQNQISNLQYGLSSTQQALFELQTKSKTPFEEARDSGKWDSFFSDVIGEASTVGYNIKTNTTEGGMAYFSGVGINTENRCWCSEKEPQPFVVINGITYINSTLLYKNNLDWCIHHNDEPEGLEIKSANYVEGKSGWILAQDGVLHIYSGNEKINFYQDGSHNKSNRKLFERYDENNACRVSFGQVEL